MNILFVHEVDWLKKVVYEIHTLSELLSLRGHKVYAVDYASMWRKKSLMDLGSLRTEYTSVARAYQEACVSLIRPGFMKIPGLSRMSTFLTHYFAIDHILSNQKIDAIILYSVPTNGLQTLYLANKYHVPVVFRSIDVLHQLVSNPILAKITYQLEKIIYHNSDLVLTISPMLSQYVVKMGASGSRVKLIPLGVDTDQFKPGINPSGDRKDKIILFVGTLYPFSGLTEFITMFYQVLVEVPEAHLLIVGDGPQRMKLQGLIQTLGLSQRVIMTGGVFYEQVVEYIKLSDVCLCPFLDTEVTRNIFPTKVIQYMACGRPVVATDLPGLTSMRVEGIIYAHGPGEVVSKTIELLKSEYKRTLAGTLALDYIKRVHDHKRIVQQVEEKLYECIADKSKA